MKYAGVQLPPDHAPGLIRVEQRQLPGARPRAETQNADRVPPRLPHEKRREHREEVEYAAGGRRVSRSVLRQHRVAIGRAHQQRGSRESIIGVVVVYAHDFEKAKVGRVLVQHGHAVHPSWRAGVKLRGFNR